MDGNNLMASSSESSSICTDMEATFIGLLREWVELIADALLEAADLDGSIKVLAPYCKNAGEAGSIALRKATGFKTNDINGLVIFWQGLCHRSCVGGDLTIWTNGNDLSKSEVNNCVFNGRNQVLCYIFCEVAAQFGWRALNDRFEMELIESISRGGDRCKWRSIGVGGERSMATLDEIDIPAISKDTMNFVALASLGETWVYLTKALIDHCGKEDAMDAILPRMSSSGRKFGERIVKEGWVKGSSSDLKDLMELVNKVLQRKFNASDQEICECPFSGSPIETCLQCESFIKGVFESVSPSNSFSFDRMMTKGDATCHWVSKKNENNTPHRSQNGSDEDEMLKNLKWRLTKGEITIDQYRQLRDVLLEW